MILDLGCGTGSASRTLAGQFPQASVIALDWAPAMLAQAGAGTGESLRRWLEPFMCRYACPASGSTQCGPDFLQPRLAVELRPARCFREFRRIMKADAMLVFTCFGPDTLHELKQAWRAVDDLPHVNDYPDMHDIGDELLAAGFREPVMDAERLTLGVSGRHVTDAGVERYRCTQCGQQAITRTDRQDPSENHVAGLRTISSW